MKTWDVLSPLRFKLKIVTNAEHFRSGCERGFPVENPTSNNVTPHFACSGLLLSAGCWLKVPAEKFVIAARFLLVTTGKPYYFVVSSFYTWQSPSCKHEALKPYWEGIAKDWEQSFVTRSLIRPALFYSLTPKIWLLFLPSTCFTFPYKVVVRICISIKITSTW